MIRGDLRITPYPVKHTGPMSCAVCEFPLHMAIGYAVTLEDMRPEKDGEPASHVGGPYCCKTCAEKDAIRLCNATLYTGPTLGEVTKAGAKIVGSQTRESYQDAGLRIVKTWPDVDRGHVVFEDETGKRELWVRSNHAGYAVTIDGVAYEFVRSL